MKERSRMVEEKTKKRKKLERVKEEARNEGTSHVPIVAKRDIHQIGVGSDLRVQCRSCK